jgi:predicted transcriptional regulator
MPETEHSQANLAAIRTRIDNLERMVRFGITADPNSKHAVEAHLRAREGAVELYLALSDGPKSQDQLRASTRLSQATISKICKHLFQGDLISKMPDPKKRGSFLYFWSDLERVIGVSKIAKKIARE